ncbi:Adenylylsulfate kinase [Pseudomonas chlororaphis subsp. aurantiaca]|uniref:Adenylyl-sulfate kinase n=2 Tax=Pseudomonas chlororaphis TaxID=587753 RepID=A0AAJ1E3B8_9PSED|nr:adenylyl-sulfate kinase [Pseudomonas chlororaphis]AZD33128.1 Adenylylsulfate kinase [Pseudomonas chlororaphis subsp. aurantiaca]AZD39459.1 Adenylylsulfate kinase [Pseudomonas chlororaphis subsp. aurantiaca]AZD64278.1 Adenylylsulfate kinase [Pseudomonas chlororaphis subsp. aurantiaca]AZD70744.1 Adenylylsulfate kinase [Pseudomonas chlororaphis subsp. aurantiaca]AZD76949.1 Adenylylsulfate kinase [Pseudomonas chlororaphis subsp. aurantiaca]
MAVMKMPSEPNLTWHRTAVTPEMRAMLSEQRPLTLWFTGLSAAGKSTLAFSLENLLVTNRIHCCVLDGDNIRHGLCRDLGFDGQSRTENIRRVAEVARLMNDAGLVVMAAFISPYRRDRELARSIIGGERFHEVHVSAPLYVCESRDPKGLYKKARRGELSGFTGVDDPYEVPDCPDVYLDTSRTPLPDCLERLAGLITARLN